MQEKNILQYKNMLVKYPYFKANINTYKYVSHFQ